MLCLNGRICGKAVMPPAMAHEDQSWPDDDGFVSVVAFDCLGIPVSDIRYSMSFYSELFALRLVAGSAEAGRVVLSRGGRTRLALYTSSGDSGVIATSVAALVESLDAAREVVWNNGITTMHGASGADRPNGGEPTFAIADPDGHVISFTEHSLHEPTLHKSRGYTS